MKSFHRLILFFSFYVVQIPVLGQGIYSSLRKVLLHKSDSVKIRLRGLEEISGYLKKMTLPPSTMCTTWEISLQIAIGFKKNNDLNIEIDALKFNFKIIELNEPSLKMEVSYVENYK